MSHWACVDECMGVHEDGLTADGFGCRWGTCESLGLRGDGCMEMRADSDSLRMGLHRDE